VLICSERKVLLAGGWFVLREKYCWLVADKPSEQAVNFHFIVRKLAILSVLLKIKLPSV
jgi:hypothetical protein